MAGHIKVKILNGITNFGSKIRDATFFKVNNSEEEQLFTLQDENIELTEFDNKLYIQIPVEDVEYLDPLIIRQYSRIE